MEEEVVIPNDLVDLQEFLENLWSDIFDKHERAKIPLYNQAANKYNAKRGWTVMSLVTNYKAQKEQASLYNSNMEKLDAASKKAVKEASKVQIKIKPAKPTKSDKPKKERSDKEPTTGKGGEIMKLARAGKSIDEIAKAGYNKTSVAWYFSKFKIKR